MRFETFAFLPPLSPQQVEAQLIYALQQGWLLTLDYIEAPYQSGWYWFPWAIPPARINSATNQSEPLTAGHVTAQIEACARRHPFAFIRLSAFNAKTQQTDLSFIARTPQEGS